MKCSDNNIFRINPVYALIEPRGEAEIDVSREKGNAKLDKLAIVVVEVIFHFLLSNF